MEKRVDRIDSQVAKIFSKLDTMNRSMVAMDKRITAIENTGRELKGIIIGAIGVYLVFEIGLVEAIRALL